MNVMAAWRSFCLSLQGYHQRCVLSLALIVGGVIISMSRAVLHLILPSSSTYIIPQTHAVVKSLLETIFPSISYTIKNMCIYFSSYSFLMSPTRSINIISVVVSCSVCDIYQIIAEVMCQYIFC